MQQTVPLVDHPELTIIECSEWREYRVVPRTQRPQLRRTPAWGWYSLNAIAIIMLAYLWSLISQSHVMQLCVVTVAFLYLYSACTQVLWESVVIIPSIGLQLETHRGLPLIPLFSSRRFLPLSSLQDFIINEGLHGWNVKFYLVAIQCSQHGDMHLAVAYENILPRFPVLLEVYHGVHETLFTNIASSDAHGT